MKTTILLSTTALFAAALTLSAAPKDELTAAVKKLADQPNYSWKTTVAVPEGGQGRFRAGPTEGKTEKDGYTVVTSQMGENTRQTVLKGEKGALTNRDGDWESFAEAEEGQGGQFRVAAARNLKAPAAQAAEILEGLQDVKKEGDVYSGELKAEAVRSLLAFGGRRGGGGGPEISNPKGTAKFWIKDGVLSKYEYKVQGTMTFNNNDRDIDRTTTVEIKDVGTTKVTVPEGAKKKIS